MSQNELFIHFGTFWYSSLAEKEGFEPPVPLPVHRISSAAHSTTLAFLLTWQRYIFFLYLIIFPTFEAVWGYPEYRFVPFSGILRYDREFQGEACNRFLSEISLR